MAECASDSLEVVEDGRRDDLSYSQRRKDLLPLFFLVKVRSSGMEGDITVSDDE